MPLGNGFPFHRLLRLVRLRFRYSTPPSQRLFPQLTLQGQGQVKVKVKVTLRLAVYRQSVLLGVKPFEVHGQIFFPAESLL
jgi:hypothetical protein